MSADAAVARLPLVAVVGRPNVGKSSLVNRVLGRREAIVEERPGVTRDRRSFVADWGGRTFEIVDTGGLEPGMQGLEARVAEQAQLAIESADVIVLVVDGTTGPHDDDLAVADVLRRSNKPVVVAVNKVDDPADAPLATEFYRLGLGEPLPLSALHGRASGDFLEALVRALPHEVSAEQSAAWAAVAIVGRPNVGKSSILNSLLKESRAIVDAVPGTTRDPVDSYLAIDPERTIRVVDTAGMRREVQISDPIEYFSFLRSRRTLERVDAALLVIDSGEGVTGHDQRLAEAIVEEGRACVIALNKWDLVTDDVTERERLEAFMAQRLRFLPWATSVRTSALTARGIDRLVPALDRAVTSHRTRLVTSSVNRIVRDAQEARPHPRSSSGRPTRILYAAQTAVSPPTVVLFATGEVESGYLRYVEKRLRDVEPFAGSPVRLEVRRRSRL